MKLSEMYALYEIVLKIRLIEEAIVKEYPLQEIKTPVHLCIGQEAIAAGVSMSLADSDCIVSNHRSHGHCLAKGLPLEGFFAELYGRIGGVSSGKGGSMHLVDMKRNILGSSAIVAGGIPIGAGFALKQRIKNENNVTVIYFGDGAVDEGIFWETINFSSLQKLPILFVMEDNGYASQTHASARHSYKDISNAIQAFDIPVVKVDGNDAIKVAEISEVLIGNIRRGGGSHFLHCSTYRYMGHVGIVDDTDTGYRPREEVDKWKELCPVKRMEEQINDVDFANATSRIADIRRNWQSNIDEVIKKVKEMPYAVD